MGTSPGVQNVVADVLSRNPVGNLHGSQISCEALRALALNSREQLIREQRVDPELGHIYRYLENPDDGSVNANICEDLLGPYPASRPERYRFVLVITDHFTKWSELIPLRKTSAQAIANAFFENYISRYGAPIFLISDNGPQFISESVGCKVTVNIDQVHVYRPRQSETISSDSHVETLYEGQKSSDKSSRSQLGKFKGSRKNSSEQNNGRKSSKGNAGWEDPRLKRKVDANGPGDGNNIKKYKICRKRSLQGSKHRNQKRLTPEAKQGRKRAIPSSVSSRSHKYRRPNNHSQTSQPIAGPSHQQDSRQDKPPTVASRQEGSG
ncbi:uncharacterized protein TNCV_2054911 [Trichonephila clavipes]|uniref:Integrase catalytic domain-containing protein n=1 Tax=Trichonephila clavipes TaxID=2585209 RepID=A0A8X6RWN1_TRICX|nr:uncharacterized protein TNCV_2054911 [Trichonephila clavipes]